MKNSQYNKNIKTPSYTQDSVTKALHLLREVGFYSLQQLDWVGKTDDRWLAFEIKEKELYKPGPNFPQWGTGLNGNQLYLRTNLLKELGLRTYLLTFAKGTNEVYGAYLDELEEKGDFFDTKNNIRIYPIQNYNKGFEAVMEDLNNGNQNSK